MKRSYLPVCAMMLSALLCACPPGTKPTPSDDAGIVGLTVNLGAASATGTAYSISLDNQVSTARIALSLPAGATATIGGVAGTERELSGLTVGDSEVVIVVTAEDRVTEKTYKLRIHRRYPPRVVLAAPASGTTDVAAAPSLVWKPSEGAAYYMLYIVEGTDIPGGTYAEYFVTGCGFSAWRSLMAPKTTYAWQIVPVDANEDEIASGASPTWTFTTGDIPLAPSSLVAAADSAGLPALSWTASAHAESYSAFRNGETTAFWSGSTLSCVDPSPVAKQANSYVVKASNGFGQSGASPSASVTVGDGGSVDITIN